MCLVINSNCNVENLEASNFHLIGENIDGSKHSFLEGSVPMLVVGSEKPFVVHEVNDAFVSKFGFEKSLVCGRSIGFLQGPKTNSLHLMGALGQVKDCLQSTCEEAPSSATGKSVVLYTKSGVESALHIYSEPLKSIEGHCKRLVSFADSEAITLHVAEQESLVSKVIIEASARQAIQSTNTRFLDMYGLKENQVTGRSLRVVHGPRTDRAGWTAMLAGAAAGATQRGRLWTCTSTCEEIEVNVRCVPVASEDGCTVQYIMLEIEPAAPAASGDKSSAAAIAPPAAAANTGLVVPAPACGGAAAARRELATLAVLGLVLALGCGGPSAAGAASSVLLHAPAPEWLGGGASARGLDRLAAAAPRARCGVEAAGGAVGTLGDGPCGMEAAPAPRVHRATALLDLDKTSIFGNDGNDLGIAMQWMGRPAEEVRQLYRLLLSPALPPAIQALRERSEKLSVAIYTRRPQLVTYSSVFEGRQVELRFDPEWHRDGQTYIPGDVVDAEDIMARYSGPALSAEERNDVVKSMERLLAARDALTDALRLPAPPVVVVTAAPKDVAATARTLALQPWRNKPRTLAARTLAARTLAAAAGTGVAGEDAAAHAYLFDDNAELRGNARVVQVPPLVALPAERAGRVLALLNERMPPAGLDPDLVAYLSDANPDELALRSVPGSDEVEWNVPMCASVAPWPLPAALRPTPAAPPAPVPLAPRCAPLLGGGLRAGGGGGRAMSGCMSPVTPAEAVAGLGEGGKEAVRARGEHRLADLRAAAEKVLLLRQAAAK